MKKTRVSRWLLALPLSLAACLLAVSAVGATDILSVLHDFTGTDGNDPNWLIQASDGNFYGTTYLGVGTVFQITPAGKFTTVFTLPPQNPNRFFYGDFFTSVVEGPDGFLYVIAPGSNNNPSPTLFKISKSGSDFQVLLQEAPFSLSVASDGNFYGVDGNGIFRLTTGGTYTLLSARGSSGFIVEDFNKQATDGNFYGPCYPVANGPQHVCRVTTSGAVTPIFAYPKESDGYALFPANGLLTEGPDGFLYGVGVGGPSAVSYQVIFQLSLSGSYREIYRINHYCNAKTGCSRALPTSDGNLWITDPVAESVFSITPIKDALLQTVSFSSQQNRYAHPQVLIQASSGILYGTTGEPYSPFGDVGSVFSLDAGLPPPR